jgi:hypothetical protein
LTTIVSLFDQDLVQVLQASVTGLETKKPYVLAFAANRDGSGQLQPLARVMTNPAVSAIVNRQCRAGSGAMMPERVSIVSWQVLGASRPLLTGLVLR